jgi:hypothetical protein
MDFNAKATTIGFVISTISLVSLGQETNPVGVDSLLVHNRSIYQTVPDSYAYFFYKALEAYPELINSRITLREAKIKTTANARPTLGSLLFRKRANRHCVIRMNVSQKPGKILFAQLDTSARIGLFGHEIGHLYDYHTRRSGKVLARGFSYFGKSSKARFEKEIDQLTIQRGLGIPLYAFSHYVLYQSDAPESYKEFKRTIYLTPEEILELIQQMESK